MQINVHPTFWGLKGLWRTQIDGAVINLQTRWKFSMKTIVAQTSQVSDVRWWSDFAEHTLFGSLSKDSMP